MEEYKTVDVDEAFVKSVHGARIAAAVPATPELLSVGLNQVFEVQVGTIPHGKAVIRSFDEARGEVFVIALGQTLEPQAVASLDIPAAIAA